jgi:hypothetical protein
VVLRTQESQVKILRIAAGGKRIYFPFRPPMEELFFLLLALPPSRAAGDPKT